MNTLRTIFSEWIKLATVIEIEHPQILPHGFFPLNGNDKVLGQFTNMADDELMKLFAELLYTRLGDISRLMVDLKD